MIVIVKEFKDKFMEVREENDKGINFIDNLMIKI